MGEVVRIFVSSPGDTHAERMRVERVIERLSGEYARVAELRAIRWENHFYTARDTFQAQIPEAADCDIVIVILRHRLGTELPPDFPTMPNGEPYPSGTAYELLTAMQRAKDLGLPDLYVFRSPEAPTIKLDDAQANEEITRQWERLKQFFARWFLTEDGQFKAAFHRFTTTDQFEQQVEALLREWLERKVRESGGTIWPIAINGSPFRGLDAFDARHAPVFFGRSRDITRSVDLLKDAASRGTPCLLVVGPSGSGKSSLAKAGILPRLTAPGVVPDVDLWRVAIMRPGATGGDPVAALAQSLFEKAANVEGDTASRTSALPELAQGDHREAASLAMLLSHADASSPSPIIAALDRVGADERQRAGYDRPVRADLLLIIDQLDEVFGIDVAPKDRERFAQLLSSLVATGRIWIVATLRADLYEPFIKVPALLALKRNGAQYDLEPPGTVELAEIVRGPAKAAGLVFESNPQTGETLDARLLADVEQSDMLPLLEFALDQLFVRREEAGGETRLTYAAYESFGGVAGAIAQAGDQALAKLGKPEIAALPGLFRRLVARQQRAGSSLQDASFVLADVPLADLGEAAAMRRLVEVLAGARLLVISNETDDRPTVRLAHQRIIESWRRAREAVRENTDYYRIVEDIRVQLRRWIASDGDRSDLLPKGRPVREARYVVRRFRSEIDPVLMRFVRLSQTWSLLAMSIAGGALAFIGTLIFGYVLTMTSGTSPIPSSAAAGESLGEGVTQFSLQFHEELYLSATVILLAALVFWALQYSIRLIRTVRAIPDLSAERARLIRRKNALTVTNAIFRALAVIFVLSFAAAMLNSDSGRREELILFFVLVWFVAIAVLWPLTAGLFWLLRRRAKQKFEASLATP